MLGTAPCSKAPCTSVLRTTDRGATWKGLPAPVVPLSIPQSAVNGSSPAVWGIRFASPTHGFAYGTGLWETTDGGEHWAKAAGPTGPNESITSLEISDGQVLAIVQVETSSGFENRLVRRSLSGDPWTTVGTVHPQSIATGSGVAAMLDGTSVLTTSDGGKHLTSHSIPCNSPHTNSPVSVAVTGPRSLALQCDSGDPGDGSVAKTVYVSSDGGSQWTEEGVVSRGTNSYGIAGGSASRLVVAAGDELYHSGDGGRTWGAASKPGSGGGSAPFSDLGFTNASDGSVVYGPSSNANNSYHYPGQLLLTSNGGATWHPVTW